MNRQQFAHVRRIARTLHTFCSVAIDQVNRTDDMDLIKHANRWCELEFKPLKAQGIDVHEVWISTRPSGGGFGPSIPALRNDPELKARFLSHFRMARYFRKPCRLPA